MTVDAWEPSGPTPTSTPSIANLQIYIDLINQDPDPQLAVAIAADQQQRDQYLMKLPRQTWIDLAAGLSTPDIIALVRFFTLAEMQLSGWQSGADSPVIGLVKALRQRGEAPDKALLQWIRANSDNRFLPNGPLLG